MRIAILSLLPAILGLAVALPAMGQRPDTEGQEAHGSLARQLLVVFLRNVLGNVVGYPIAISLLINVGTTMDSDPSGAGVLPIFLFMIGLPATLAATVLVVLVVIIRRLWR